MILIGIYALLEFLEFYSTKDAKNAFEYLAISLQNYEDSKIRFALGNLNFVCLLFLIFVCEIMEFGIIIAGILKFCDICARLWLFDKRELLESLKPILEQFGLSNWMKFLNPLCYTFLVAISIMQH